MVDALSPYLGVVSRAVASIQDVHFPLTSISVLDRIPVKRPSALMYPPPLLPPVTR